MLDQTGLRGDVEIEVADNTLVIRPARGPRDGWAESFAEMARRGDDRLLDADAVRQSSWDEDEWEW